MGAATSSGAAGTHLSTGSRPGAERRQGGTRFRSRTLVQRPVSEHTTGADRPVAGQAAWAQLVVSARRVRSLASAWPAAWRGSGLAIRDGALSTGATAICVFAALNIFFVPGLLPDVPVMFGVFAVDAVEAAEKAVAAGAFRRRSSAAPRRRDRRFASATSASPTRAPNGRCCRG